MKFASFSELSCQFTVVEFVAADPSVRFEGAFGIISADVVTEIADEYDDEPRLLYARMRYQYVVEADNPVLEYDAVSAGVMVIVVIGLGFTAYGLFCASTFTHRRLEAP